MSPRSLSTRVVGIVFSIVMSMSVLGAVALSMQPALAVDAAQIVALEHVTVTAPALN